MRILLSCKGGCGIREYRWQVWCGLCSLTDTAGFLTAQLHVQFCCYAGDKGQILRTTWYEKNNLEKA